MPSNTNNNNQSSLSSALMTGLRSSETTLPHCDSVATEYTLDNNAVVGTCLSISPPQHAEFELDRVRSITFLHILTILCTDIFLIFQNTLSIFFVGNLLELPPSVLYFISILCALATSLQVVLARGFKIVMTPIHLTLQQRCLLNAIEKQLERLKLKTKRTNTPHALLVLLSPVEKKALESTLFSWGHSNYEHDFNYALLRLAEEHKIPFHVLSCHPNCFPQIKENIEARLIRTSYRILSYSPEYFSYTRPLTTNTTNPQHRELTIDVELAAPLKEISLVFASPSLLRFFQNSIYRSHIYQQEKLAFLLHIARSAPNFILLSVLPVFAAIFQGVSSLNDMVDGRNINGWSRLEIIIPGIMIGGARGTMTYFAKVPVAHDRASKFLTCHNNWKDEVEYTAYSRNALQDLCALFSCDSKISSYKRYLLVSYYMAPIFYMLLATFSALGTIAFYAGLGLFFSNAGLFYVIEFFLNPRKQAIIDTSNNGGQYIFSISMALLNGFWNQGYETVKSFYISSLNLQKHTNTLIKDSKATWQYQMPNMIRQIVYENTAIENVITFAILIDSFAAGCTTFNGGTKILVALADIMRLSDTHINTLAGCMALGVFVTQIFFSHELMEKDMRNGGTLWRMVYDVWLPTWLKNCVGIPNATSYPSLARPSHFFPPEKSVLSLENPLTSSSSNISLASSSSTVLPESPKKSPTPVK